MSVAGALHRLEGAGLIRLAQTEPQVAYIFRHALIHEAAYESLARDQRRRLHRAVGEVLEELLADRRDEVASTLAYHFARAELRDRAAHYQLRAANRAAVSFANSEAIGFYQAALEDATSNLLTRDEVASAFERLGGVLELVGRLDEAVAAYGEALASTDSVDILARARRGRRQANAHRIARRTTEARELFESSAALLDGVPVEERSDAWWSEQLDLLLDRAWLHYFWGPLDEMARALEGCAPAIDRYASDAQRTRYYARLALLEMSRNHTIWTDEALAMTTAAYDAWQATGDPTDVELARFQLGLCHVLRGEIETARRFLGESMSAAELTGDVVLQSRCLSFLALAARFAGDIAEMERIQARAMPVLLAGGMTEYLASMAANRCWAAWRRGDLAEAQAHGAESLEIAAQLPGRYALEWSVRLPLLAMALERDDLPEAMEDAVALEDQSWIDEEYGRALRAAIDADAAGDASGVREQLQSVVEQARRVGRL